MIVREVFTAIAIVTVGVLLWNQFKPAQCFFSGQVTEYKSMSVWTDCKNPPGWWIKLDDNKRSVISEESGA